MDPQISSVAFSYYPVKDMAISRAFYEGILGLTLGMNFGGACQEYDLGETTFSICAFVVDSRDPSSQGSVAFEVKDLKGLVHRLQEKKVPFVNPEVMETPVCWMALIRDPDGNTITLHQRK